MSQAELKQQLRELIAQRDLIELEVEGLSAKLNAPGGPGLKGNLLDKEVRPVIVAHSELLAQSQCSRLLATFRSRG